MPYKNYFGIDFGTTCSGVSVFQQDDEGNLTQKTAMKFLSQTLLSLPLIRKLMRSCAVMMHGKSEISWRWIMF